MLLALTPEQAGAGTSARGSAAAAERALFDAILAGDERQASQVYASLLPAIQCTLLRVLGAPDQNHRQLTQRSIEHVIVELARHPGPWVCRLHVWATSVAGRVALDVLRARAQRRDVEVSWGDAMAQSSANDRNAVSPGSAIDQLRWLLTELPAQQAEAIVSCDVMGLAVEDVAQTLHVGVEHVRRLLSAGHERLARQMSTDARA